MASRWTQQAARTACGVMMLICAGRAQARNFDFNSAHFAVYFGGTFGSTGASDTAYGLAGGAGTLYDKAEQSASSGEFGIVLGGERLGLRLGAEYLMPRDLAGITGSDTAGNALFTLHSNLSALIPEANLEYKVLRGTVAHMLIGVGYGYAIASVRNDYVMSTAGQSKFNLGDYSELGSGTGAMLQAYLGFEFLLTDMVTMTLDAGYRSLLISGFKATQNANAISGTETNGSDLVNMDGSKRQVNLSGGFAGINFRFYL